MDCNQVIRLDLDIEVPPAIELVTKIAYPTSHINFFNL